MQNGYFRLVNDSDGFGVALYQPKDGGEEIQIDELTSYLDGLKISYDRRKLELLLLAEVDSVCRLGRGPCPAISETYTLNISADGMAVIVRFIAPTRGGKRLTYDEFLHELRGRNIKYGIQEQALREHFVSDDSYCTDILAARGLEAVQGTDASIEYCFNTDTHRKPTQREDGTVDYFNLTIINHCKKGDVLARIIPETPGIPGSDVYGNVIAPRETKREVLKFGRNIQLSEDKNSIVSLVDGHVSLVDEKVFVADVYQVKNVDVSTGNIDYDGSVEVTGYIAANFEVKAGGNIIVNGLVEGAKLFAGGNIIIAKGMNGMGKGYLKAGGDIVVKFLENTRVATGGSVEAEAILHSKVSAGTEVRVDGRKGIIVGGYVQAANRVTAKVVGAGMGASTILEVGVNPLIKTQYNRMQKAIADDTKTVKNAEVILENFKEKLKKGVQYNESQLKYLKTVTTLVEEKNRQIEQMNTRLERFRALMETQKNAEVIVNDQIYPGTTIIISDATKTIQNNYHYCKFVREQGEVTMKPL